MPGNTVTYTIVASNAGPSAVTGATVAEHFPAALTGATWTCVGAGGGTCPASGAGNINDARQPARGRHGDVHCDRDALAGGDRHARQHGDGDGAGGVTDPIRATTGAPTPTRITPQADLSITKTDGVDDGVAGRHGDLHDRRRECGAERRDRRDGGGHIAGGADRCDVDVRRAPAAARARRRARATSTTRSICRSAARRRSL